ncbi:MAG TPA: signal peptidase I [Thermoplasmata archaeon]|nr:signal peptidase I [Thermoplasmata archaeon]
MTIDLALSVGLLVALAGFASLPWLFGRRMLPWSLALLTLWTTTAYVVWGSLAPGSWGYLAYGLYACAPLALFGLFVAVWEERRITGFGFPELDRRWLSTVAMSAGLVGVYLLLTLEPGLALGFYTPPTPAAISLGVFVLTTPVLVLGQEAVFRGYFLTQLSDRIPFGLALTVSAGLFALYGFSPILFGQLSISALAPQLFVEVLGGFAMGVVVGLYYYRTGWSLLGPWGFRTGVVWAALVVPWSVARLTWEFQFLFLLIGLAGVLVVSTLLLAEPRFRARHYLGEAIQPRRRTLIARQRSRRQLLEAGVLVIVVGALVAGSAPVLESLNGAPVRFLAIASGSMVPALRVGDLVVVEHIGSADQIHLRDLVAYEAPYLSPSGPVVHRVVAIQPNGSAVQFTFQGDANRAPDPRPVQFGQIVGRVVLVVPIAGNLVLFPPFPIAIVAFLALFTAYRTLQVGRRRTGHPRPILDVRTGGR